MERPLSPRTQNLAVLLPLLGLFLLMPPFIALFGAEPRAWGVPLAVAYLFGVWALLLVAAAWLARLLRPREAESLPPADGEGKTDGDAAAPPG